MELMRSPLEEGLERKNANALTFPKVASRLIDILETIHEEGKLVIDIKPDNFMVAMDGRVCMVDIALLQDFMRDNKHRKNVDGGVGAVVGTPLYVSLNVHDGAVPSRRDDMEAMGYVLVELCLGELPWSKGRSDEDVAKQKRAVMDNDPDSLYAKLGRSRGRQAGAFREYFEHCRTLKYKEKPDYDLLRGCCRQMVGQESTKTIAATRPVPTIPTAAAAAAAAATTTTKKRTRPTRGSAVGRSGTAVSNKNGLNGTRPAKRHSPSKRQPMIVDLSGFQTSGDEANGGTMDCHDEDQDFFTVADEEHGEHDEFRTCTDYHEDVDMMDWEAIGDDDDDETPVKTPAGGAQREVCGQPMVRLSVIEGPHKGASIDLWKNKSITIGSGPNQDLVLAKDNSIDSSHLKATLLVKKSLKKVVVATRKGITTPVVVGSHEVRRGGEWAAFLSDRISLGPHTVLALSPISAEEQRKLTPSSPSPIKTTTATPAAAAAAISTTDSISTMDVELVETMPTTDRTENRGRPKIGDTASRVTRARTADTAPCQGNGYGLLLTVVDGPHAGERVALVSGELSAVWLSEGRHGSDWWESADERKRPGASFVVYAVLDGDDEDMWLTVSPSSSTSSTSSFGVSHAGVWLNGKRQSKRLDAFAGDTLRVGDSRYRVESLLPPQEQKLSARDLRAARRNNEAHRRALTTNDDGAIVSSYGYSDLNKENKDHADIGKKPAPKAEPTKAVVASRTTTKSKTKPRVGASLNFLDGPHEGESIELSTTGVTKIVVGSKPKGADTFVLRDSTVEACHARLELDASRKGFCTVMVSSLKSDSGVSVNGQAVRKGKTTKAFFSDSLTIGKSTIAIKQL